MRDPLPSARALTGARARLVNGAPLRWTPGPDELRLPFEEDEPVPQNTQQVVAIEDGFGGLRERWRGRRDVFVGSDQFIHWDRAYNSQTNPENPPVAPDVYVAFGVANRHRLSYVVWEEGKPPDFVLEVVSPSSRRQDREEKRVRYAKMGVPEFFWYDPAPRRQPALAGFELQGDTYAPLREETVADGVVGIPSKVLGLCLCIRAPGPDPLDVSLCWYDPATGEFLPTRHELADDKRRLAEANRRLAEANRQTEAKVAELEALVEEMRLRGEPNSPGTPGPGP